MRSAVTRSIVLGLAVALLATATADAQPGTSVPQVWPGCCGLTPWAQAGELPARREGGGALFQGYRYIVGGSALRHHLGVNGEIPAPYAHRRQKRQPRRRPLIRCRRRRRTLNAARSSTTPTAPPATATPASATDRRRTRSPRPQPSWGGSPSSRRAAGTPSCTGASLKAARSSGRACRASRAS